ncbi:MAG: hypothetical protein AABX63_00575 [Nanoarchaeota archaeon]
MSLDDVIVTESQVADLYIASYAEKFYGVLEEMGLLPLTVGSLTTEEGMSLLHLATWVWASGDLHNKGFTPRVCGDNEFLNELANGYFSGLGKKFEFHQKNELVLAEDSGAIGRLINAMGVNKPETEHEGPKMRKTIYDNSMPHYFTDIAKALPSGNPTRTELLYTITRIMFKDRLTYYFKPTSSRGTAYLELHCHPDRQSALGYGKEAVDFLNNVFRTNWKNKNLFGEDQIRVVPNNEVYQCRLMLSDQQIGYLATRKSPILEFKVSY